jgi:hypothetical protein
MPLTVSYTRLTVHSGDRRLIIASSCPMRAPGATKDKLRVRPTIRG